MKTERGVNMEGSTLVEAMKTGFTGIAGDLTSALGEIVPIAIGVVGAVMVVTFGISMFKRISGRGSN